MTTEAAQPVEGNETPQTDPFVDRAKAAGWRPLEEFEGDKEKWVDAKEFVSRAPLYEKNHKLSKKVTDLERTIHELKGHLGKVSEAAYNRAMNDLMKQRDEAIEFADKDRVKEIDKQIRETEGLKPDATPAPDPALKAWEEENGKWFYGDPDISGFGHAFCANYFNRTANGTWEEALDKMEKAVKKAFPEKFENPKRHTPPPVESGGTQGGKKGFTRSDLTDEQRKVMQRWVRHGVSEEEYIKGLVEAGELKR